MPSHPKSGHCSNLRILSYLNNVMNRKFVLIFSYELSEMQIYIITKKFNLTRTFIGLNSLSQIREYTEVAFNLPVSLQYQYRGNVKQIFSVDFIQFFIYKVQKVSSLDLPISDLATLLSITPAKLFCVFGTFAGQICHETRNFETATTLSQQLRHLLVLQNSNSFLITTLIKYNTISTASKYLNSFIIWVKQLCITQYQNLLCVLNERHNNYGVTPYNKSTCYLKYYAKFVFTNLSTIQVCKIIIQKTLNSQLTSNKLQILKQKITSLQKSTNIENMPSTKINAIRSQSLKLIF
eukprot:TRINITY_DN3459_c0_g1_i3.p1 TRINITY_DN3459_c0_g1~~TRINITY_DN3459_c0_g1_i3.p1  ORF type:complete len:294 (+),score=-29.09 TRINITY_DN3459_c0_g1_i3:64-945(+)